MLFRLFDMYEAECQRIIGPGWYSGYTLPKCSHTFNLLNPAISVAERASSFAGAHLARLCAEGTETAEEMAFLLLKNRSFEGGRSAVPASSSSPATLKNGLEKRSLLLQLFQPENKL